MKNPLVSIIILNWNGKDYLNDCLNSLQKASYRQIEIIVVDQNSKDGSQKLIKNKYKDVKLIENKSNTGYVGGNNLGVSKANGKYVFIMNNDIVVEKNFLEPLVLAFEKKAKLGVAQPKAINLREKGKLDGGGSYFTKTGFLYHKGFMDKASKPAYNKRYPVYSVKGAYMITRRKLFNEIGGLDSDFFIYFEESDYCGRVWLAGFSVEYIPTSVVYHWGGGDTEKDWENKFALVQYRLYKNRICSYIKNLSFSYLVIVIPINIFLSLGGAMIYLFTGNYKTTISILKAIWWNVINLKKTLDKRKMIQGKIRKVSDREVFRIVEFNPRLNYYINSFRTLGK